MGLILLQVVRTFPQPVSVGLPAGLVNERSTSDGGFHIDGISGFVARDAQSPNICSTAAVKPSPPRFASGGLSVYELPHDASANYDTVFLGQDQCIR